MKKQFLILLAAGMLCQPVWAEIDALHYNIVSFSESASANVTNDLMTVSFVVSTEGSDRNEVSNQTTRRLNALNRRITALADIKAELQSRNVQPRYNDKGKISGWRDAAYVRVESKNFERLNKLIADSQNDAAVQNMGFGVSPQKRDETVASLSKQALENFRKRAALISKTMGFGSYRIVSINLNNDFRSFNNAPVMLKARMAPMAAEVMDTMPSGEDEISQTVNGTIQMQ